MSIIGIYKMHKKTIIANKISRKAQNMDNLKITTIDQMWKNMN